MTRSTEGADTDIGKISLLYHTDFSEALEDDLNTPQALAVAWNMLKDDSLSPADKRATLLAMDQVLGLDLANAKSVSISLDELPTEVQKLVEEREAARKAKDFAAADALRENIREAGFEIEDGDVGPHFTKKN